MTFSYTFQSETLYIVLYIIYFKYLLKEFKLLNETFLHVNTDKTETVIIPLIMRF